MEHMTKAAEELSIAQPSLSKTIRRLEKEMGVPLFDRQEDLFSSISSAKRSLSTLRQYSMN